ncbi:Mitotic spindle checkpoint protein MAD2 [Linum perenne]
MYSAPLFSAPPSRPAARPAASADPDQSRPTSRLRRPRSKPTNQPPPLTQIEVERPAASADPDRSRPTSRLRRPRSKPTDQPPPPTQIEVERPAASADPDRSRPTSRLRRPRSKPTDQPPPPTQIEVERPAASADPDRSRSRSKFGKEEVEGDASFFSYEYPDQNQILSFSSPISFPIHESRLIVRVIFSFSSAITLPFLQWKTRNYGLDSSFNSIPPESVFPVEFTLLTGKRGLILLRRSVFDVLAYTNKEVSLPFTWIESAPKLIYNPQMVKLHSFDTKIHKVDNLNSYKKDEDSDEE